MCKYLETSEDSHSSDEERKYEKIDENKEISEIKEMNGETSHENNTEINEIKREEIPIQRKTPISHAARELTLKVNLNNY